jgi:glycosyltransferase involved in cell wall biosynthesis
MLEAFAILRHRVPAALLLLVGSLSPGVELAPVYDRLGLRAGEDVIHVDYVDEARLWAFLSACDVCVNLRHPTMGETSGIVIRALSAGRPLVVSDVGWFAELPSDVAVKVPVGEEEVEAIASALERLVREPRLRVAMGEAGRSAAQGQHELGRVADAYVAALEEAAGGVAAREAVLVEIARAASEIGVAQDGPALTEISERLKELGP